MDNRSNQNNPNNDAYWRSRGYSSRPSNDQKTNSGSSMSKAAQDFRSQQLNPNNKNYYNSRKN